jgi:hypothetical protein
MGVGYEILMLAGKHDNAFTRAISAPGIWIQRITTKEPTEDMLEIAITSIKCALRDEFPEFMEFYNNREWEKKDENREESVESAEAADKSEEISSETTEPECIETEPAAEEKAESEE